MIDLDDIEDMAEKWATLLELAEANPGGMQIVSNDLIVGINEMLEIAGEHFVRS